MAKKLVAVTAIKHDGEEFAEGSELDASKFTKEQLKDLYDAGAVEVKDENEESEQPTVQTPMQVDQTVGDETSEDSEEV